MAVKRVRMPHYITGLGDGNVNRPPPQELQQQQPKIDLAENLRNANVRRRSGGGDLGPDLPHALTDARLAAQKHSAFAAGAAAAVAAAAEKKNNLQRGKWEIYLDSGDSSGDAQSHAAVTASTNAGPWQLSAVALLAAVVLLSALFLHMISDAQKGHYSYSYHHSRDVTSTKSPSGKTRRKKKTDEWNEDEEETVVNESSSHVHQSMSSDADDTVLAPAVDKQSPALYYQPSAPQPGLQQHRHRKSSYASSQQQQQQPTPQQYPQGGQPQQQQQQQQPPPPPSQTSPAGGGFQHRNYYLPPSGGYPSSSTSSYNMTPTSAARVITRTSAGGSPHPPVPQYGGTASSSVMLSPSGHHRRGSDSSYPSNAMINSSNNVNSYQYPVALQYQPMPPPPHRYSINNAGAFNHHPQPLSTVSSFESSIAAASNSSGQSQGVTTTPASGTAATATPLASRRVDQQSSVPSYSLSMSSPSPKAAQEPQSPALVHQSQAALLIPTSAGAAATTASTYRLRRNSNLIAHPEDGRGERDQCSDEGEEGEDDDNDDASVDSRDTPPLRAAPKIRMSDLVGTPRVSNMKQIIREGGGTNQSQLLPQQPGLQPQADQQQLPCGLGSPIPYNRRHSDDIQSAATSVALQFQYEAISGSSSTFNFACPPKHENDRPDSSRESTDRAPDSTSEAHDKIPFLPTLSVKAHPMVAQQPPKSVNLDELQLYQMMESGNVSHWEARVAEESRLLQDQVFPKKRSDQPASSSEDGEYVSNDPRQTIRHKRPDLTISTDSAASLQGTIAFSELRLVEVIGGGGFGQVWKAVWRGTPVAVKILTGSAQSKNVPRAVLEEFVAEINLLKGMRHPNICLYMGACLNPPNRAIITELAANGSLWDALRLPLAPPYDACDGISRAGWPMTLYKPDARHGAPPSAVARLQPPIPPKGSWPWELVKRVACGAARGMAYLHSGRPPVLHRDLKVSPRNVVVCVRWSVSLF